MKKIAMVLNGAVLLCPCLIWAQTSSPSRLLKWSDSSLSAGDVHMSVPTIGLDAARVYFPESEILQKDLSQYTLIQGGRTNYFLEHPVVQLSAGFKLNPAKAPSGLAQRLTFRVGAMIYSSQPAEMVLTANTRTPWDTLTSSQTGQVILLDSAWDSQVHYDLRQTQVQLTGSCNLDLLDKSRWKIQAGAGISAGVALDTYSQVQYFEQNNVVGQEGYSPYFPYIVADHFEHKFDFDRTFHSPTFTGTAYLPVTLQYRVSKEKPEKAETHLFYEFRPFASSNFLPGRNWQGTTGMMHQLGIRIELPQ